MKKHKKVDLMDEQLEVIIACSSEIAFPWLRALSQKMPERHFLFVTSPDALVRLFAKNDKIQRIYFPHWSYIIPPDIFNKVECVIFHMTDLPYGRGGSPLQNLILQGASKTKVSALRCIRELDAGPVYLKCDLPLLGTADEILKSAYEVISGMISHMESHVIVPEEQKGEATNFSRRKPFQSQLPSTGELTGIYDFIRMLDAPGYPKAYIGYNNFRLEFSDAVLCDNEVSATVKFIEASE